MTQEELTAKCSQFLHDECELRKEMHTAIYNAIRYTNEENPVEVDIELNDHEGIFSPARIVKLYEEFGTIYFKYSDDDNGYPVDSLATDDYILIYDSIDLFQQDDDAYKVVFDTLLWSCLRLTEEQGREFRLDKHGDGISILIGSYEEETNQVTCLIGYEDGYINPQVILADKTFADSLLSLELISMF